METTKINVCVDKETKKAVETLLNEMGLNMTSAINIYFKKILMEQGIPFDLNVKQPNKATMSALNEYDAMKNNASTYKRYKNIDDALNDLQDNA